MVVRNVSSKVPSCNSAVNDTRIEKNLSEKTAALIKYTVIYFTSM